MRQFFKIICLLIINFSFSQEWVETRIPGVGVLNFPSEAELFDQQGVLVYKVENQDAFYLLSLYEMDPKYSSGIKENLNEFYRGNIQGAIEAAQGKLISQKDITIDGVEAMDLSYTSVSNPELPKLRYKRLVFVSPFVVSVEFMPKTANEANILEQKFKFLNSLKLDANIEETYTIDTNVEQSEAFEKGYSIGYILGRIVFFVLFLGGIIVIIIFFVMRSNKRKKSIISQNVKTKHVLIKNIHCAKCDTENKSESKYCSKCGFTLPR